MQENSVKLILWEFKCPGTASGVAFQVCTVELMSHYLIDHLYMHMYIKEQGCGKNLYNDNQHLPQASSVV